MVATAIKRPAETQAISGGYQVELRCRDCGRVVGILGILHNIPPGFVWTRIRCPDRRCTRWSVFDVATGEPFRPENLLH